MSLNSPLDLYVHVLIRQEKRRQFVHSFHPSSSSLSDEYPIGLKGRECIGGELSLRSTGEFVVDALSVSW